MKSVRELATAELEQMGGLILASLITEALTKTTLDACIAPAQPSNGCEWRVSFFSLDYHDSKGLVSTSTASRYVALSIKQDWVRLGYNTTTHGRPQYYSLHANPESLYEDIGWAFWWLDDHSRRIPAGSGKYRKEPPFAM
jgi:hypothetical protein